MNRLRALIFISLFLLTPLLHASGVSLKICNKGKVDFAVATAAKLPGLYPGAYKWDTQGWYRVSAGDCSVVYDETFWGAGLLTPNSEALIAYAVVDSAGNWEGLQREEDSDDDWMKGGRGKICVHADSPFEIRRPAGDPTAECDGFLMPVTVRFIPETDAKYIYKTHVDLSLLVPVGPRKSSDRPNPPHEVAPRPAVVPAPVTVAPPSPPVPPPPPADDPIGAGGFITPYVPPPQAAAPVEPRPQIKIELCVPPNLVNNLSWDRPATGSEMARFKDVLSNSLSQVRRGSLRYRIKDDAFEIFTHDAQLPSPFTSAPWRLYNVVPSGQSCPTTDYVYTIYNAGPGN